MLLRSNFHPISEKRLMGVSDYMLVNLSFPSPEQAADPSVGL